MAAVSTKEAEEILKRYIVLLYKLVVIEGNKFDLIVGAGDSGAFMAKIGELFYRQIKKIPPPIIYIPLLRYIEPGVADGVYFDNSVLLPQIKKQINSLSNFKNVLFVDDEIRKGHAAKSCIELILAALPKKKIPKRILYTIIAENHHFEWHYDVPPVAIRYYAFSRIIPGVNGAVFDFISDSIAKIFRNERGSIIKKQLANIFVNGFSKQIFNGVPLFSKELANYLLNTTHFPKTQKIIFIRLKHIISEGIGEYKSRKI